MQGSDIIWSREGTCEGTCQGDLLAMAFYALATMPLIGHITGECHNASNVWYVDDAAAIGKCKPFHDFWTSLTASGPEYGYFPNARKTILLVKPSAELEARQRFTGSGLQIRTDGVHYLGGCIGTPEFSMEYLSGLIDEWSGIVDRLSQMARTQAQAAYQVMVTAVQGRLQFIQRDHQM